MSIVRAISCLMLVVAAGGCGGTQRDEQAGTRVGAHREPGASRQVTGTVKHIDLEGVFYGIVTDDGQKLDPANLPDAFKKDGVRIRARVEMLEGRVSTHMWGTLVRIIDIERLQ
jgi:hypothetical protein